MTAPDIVVQLIQRFQSQLPDYRAGRYNETQLRRDYLDPFFEALGWDMTNRKNYSEKYREVINEVSVEVEGQAKAADYAFQSGGGVLFFLEAKKPAVNIETNPEPAFQIRRYAWSAKVPVSLLSDFEQLAVYDCREKPALSDPAHYGRVNLYSYQDYAEKWDEIYDLFSHQAVHQGSLDRFAVSLKGKRGTADVDDDFLAEMERWRKELARNIALRNPGLTPRDINYAVQMTIDRIIFLRICEDRGIEPENALRDATDGIDVYGDLLLLFNQADRKYNSGLFHFNSEKGQPSYPDTLTPTLSIDDRVLKDILANLYYPKSPYAFKYITADILGQVYERFLGKVIRLTAGHQARVEEKPEVRKAGGVYYTPTYIVDYIVKNTVGELLKDKDPQSLERSPLRVLDPACGSGSFLLGAYQYLLDWYLDWYVQHDPAKWARGKNPPIFESRDTWQLTMEKKKDILTGHIFGVDIDPQAVEVTKLSLLLKVVENPGQLSLMSERILPDLGDNIQCGNSLIGQDYYDGRQLTMFDEEEQYRVNAFDWQAAFPQVFRDGGFDAVIGNPPYIFTRNEGIEEYQKTYFYSKYKYQSVQLNTFGIFLEKSFYLMRRGGILGFITPNNWLTIDSFSQLRKFILEKTGNLSFVNILDHVFQSANVDTAITIFSKDNPTIITISEMENKFISETFKVDITHIKPPHYIIQISLLKDLEAQPILAKIENLSKHLSQFAVVSTGLKVYQTGKGKPPQSDAIKRKRAFHSEIPLNNTYGRYLKGVDVGRYRLSWSGEYLSYGDWIAEPRKSVPFTGDRILVRQIPSKPPYLINGFYIKELFYNDINSMVIFSPSADISLLYILGLINSRAISFWFMKTFDKLQRKTFPQFKVNELASFPIRTIDFTNPVDVKRHKRMVGLVESMLDLHKQLAAAQRPDHKERLQRQIDMTDRQIDALVYELYDLTAEEIKIIESA